MARERRRAFRASVRSYFNFMQRPIKEYPVTYFIVYVQLNRELKWYEIFKKKYAEVYAIIHEKDMVRAEKYLRRDLEKRDYKILKIPSRGNYDDRQRQLPKYTRMRIGYAMRDGHHYSFSRISKSEIVEFDEGVQTVTVTSRYGDNPDVTIDLSNIPEELHEIIPYAKLWAIGDDVERSNYVSVVPLEEKKAFVDKVKPLFDTIERYCNENRDQAPVPDEVVLLDMMCETYTELLFEVGE